MVFNRLNSIIKVELEFITGKQVNYIVIWKEKRNTIREKSFQKPFLLPGFKVVGSQ